MNGEMFYLTCFLVGITLSILAFLGGACICRMCIFICHTGMRQFPV